jgi:hypothetical protein
VRIPKLQTYHIPDTIYTSYIRFGSIPNKQNTAIKVCKGGRKPTGRVCDGRIKEYS